MKGNRRPPNGSPDANNERGKMGFLSGLLLTVVALAVLAMVPFVASRVSDAWTGAGAPDDGQLASPDLQQLSGSTDDHDGFSIVVRDGVTEPTALPFGVPDLFSPLTADSPALASIADGDSRLVSPEDGEVVRELAPEVSGIATASAGVSQVTIEMANTSLNRAWTTTALRAELSDPGATSTTWSLPAEMLYEQRADLWPGQYLLSITTTDSSSNQEVSYGRFWVERRGPLIQPIQPLGDQIVGSPEVTVAGTARDDVELVAIEVALVDENGDWLQPDGSFRDRRVDLPADTTGLNEPATSWTLSATLNAPGRYTAFITAHAWDGQKSSRRRTFEYRPSGVPDPTGHATILMARSLRGAGEDCDDSPATHDGGVSIFEVAEALTDRGLVATASAISRHHAGDAPPCDLLGGSTVSWDDMGELRDRHGWTFVSHGQTYAAMNELTPQEQKAESCGSLEAFADRGHEDAWGMFVYPQNRFTDAAQTAVGTCFAYARSYGSRYNEVSAPDSPRMVSVLQASGGHCGDAALPCFNANLLSSGRRYTAPSQIIQLMTVPEGHWAIVQFYRFVTGQNLTGTERWDCTAPDPAAHWTNSGELYCWADFLAVADSIGPEVDVTDPASVARRYRNPVSEAN